MSRDISECRADLKQGDYVLATKFSDGDPCDHFYVGFFNGYTNHGRYLVADSKGMDQRPNGFRRCEKITTEEGNKLVLMFLEISDKRGPSLWKHLKVIRENTMSIIYSDCSGELGQDTQRKTRRIKQLEDACLGRLKAIEVLVTQNDKMKLHYQYLERKLSRIQKIAAGDPPRPPENRLNGIFHLAKFDQLLTKEIP